MPVVYVDPYGTVSVGGVVPISVLVKNRLTVTSPLGSFAGFPDESWTWTLMAEYSPSSEGNDGGTQYTAIFDGIGPMLVRVPDMLLRLVAPAVIVVVPALYVELNWAKA